MPAEVVGREAELRAVAAFLDGLRAAPGALVITGEAGVGKTTLLRAGAALAADRGLTVLRTMPASSDMRLSFAGLADLLQPCLSLIGELPPPQARALRVALLLEEPPPHPPDPHAIAAACRAAATRLSGRRRSCSSSTTCSGSIRPARPPWGLPCAAWRPSRSHCCVLS